MHNSFYFDFISPYAYLAWKQLFEKKLTNRFQLIPVSLGKVFSTLGQTPVTENVPKREYLYKRAQKFATEHNFELNLPIKHPFNSLYLLRLTISALESKIENSSEFINTLWDMTWKNKLDIENPDEIVRTLKEKGFENAEDLYEKSFDRDIKSKHKQNTKEAIEKKVFGVPSFIVQNELFWGVDTINDFEDQL